MSLASLTTGESAPNQPITISSSPTLPSPREFLAKRNARRSPSDTMQENVGPRITRHDTPASSQIPNDQPRMPFNELVGNFGYSRKPASPARAVSGEAPTKRRRIEMQDQKALAPVQRKAKSEMPPPTKPAKRTKSPKKKLQTITALATAPYLPKDTLERGSTPEETVLEQPAKKAARSAQAAADSDKPKKPRKPRSKAAGDAAPAKPKKAAKPKAVKKTKSKATVPRQELYTPQKATEQMLRQDFLFGTSSQLAVPESPSFIRQIQTAVGESETNLISSQAMQTAQHKSYFKVPSAPHGTNLSIGQGSKELWCNAARDLNGGVARTYSTMSKLGAPARRTPAPVKVTIAPTTSTVSRTSFSEQGALSAKPADPQPDQSMVVEAVPEIVEDSSGYVDIDSYTALRPPPGTYRVRDAARVGTPKDAKLSTQSAKLSYSTQHSTSKMLADLVDLADVPPSTQAAKPKRSRATTTKKKKAAQASPPEQPKFTTDEISDDEVLASPSPPRVRGKKSPPAIKPLILSPAGSQALSPTKANKPSRTNAVSTMILSATASFKITDEQWPDIAKLLFPRIADIIKSTPHSTKLEDVTWHEKILLYDPIILEDLTAWLNEQGLTIQVTRLKRKPKTTKKKKDEPTEEIPTEPAPETEVVEEPLQCWMIQKWCEEHSICCCSKDTTFKGSARAKY